MLSGGVLSVPAVLHHEYLSLPFDVVLGLAAGMIGRLCREGKRSGPLRPSSTSASTAGYATNLIKPRIDRQFLLLVLIAVVMEAASRTGSAHAFPHRLFALLASNLWLQALVWLCAPISSGWSRDQSLECPAR